MTFPASALPITVEAWLGAGLGWVPVPIRTEAGGGGVKIKRDRKPGAPLPDPGRCDLVVDNLTKDWSPRNPRGAYYGLLGRNTPVRVSFDGGLSYRFVGEVSSWAPRWSLSGNDRYVPVTASGILRRLFASNAPARSAMRRAYAAAGPVAYWPLEDGVSAQRAGSALPGHPPLTITGTVAFVGVEDYTDFRTLRFGTGQLVELKAGAALSASAPGEVTAATGSAWTACVTMLAKYDTLSGDLVLLDVWTPGGTFDRWQLILRTATLRYELVAYAGTVGTVVAFESGVSNQLAQFDVSVWQNGASINATVRTWNGGLSHRGSGSVAGTLAGVAAVGVNPGRVTSSTTLPAGHLAVFPTAALPTLLVDTGELVGEFRYGPLYSWLREPATVRLARLCDEEGVTLDMPAVDVVDDFLMGWQPVGTFAELVAQCVDADGGLLLEARDGLGLVYRPRTSLYNLAPAVQLDYAAGHIAAPFEPVDDDDQVANDVVVERTDGSSHRARLEAGPLSVAFPPDGIGPYEQQVTLNLESDRPLPDRAGWLLHLGTVDRARYEQVPVWLDGAALAADPARSAAVAAVDAGDLAELVELPDWLPPGPELARVYGYEETADVHTWRITWTAGPGEPWTIATADGEPRATADGATLAAAVDADDTALLLTAPTGGAWTTDPADFPLDVLVGGELVTLSAISGSSSPWTATVSARAVNGVTRGWAAGTAVDVAEPAVAPL